MNQDRHDETLLANVHPAAHVNPEPKPRYDLVVVGAGTAGLVAAAGAAGLGAKVALVERDRLGGDCLNYGCVPSKTLIRSARAAFDAREAGALGVRTGGVTVDFPAVMERMRRLRARISANDSVARFRGLGVDVFLGVARFERPDAVSVGGKRLRFRKAVVATGGRAAVPAIPGLAEAGFKTNETVFGLTELPRRLAVIGGGPIGCELAQAFRRFGSEVTLVHKHTHLLQREDPDAAAVVQDAFVKEGIALALGHGVRAVAVSAAGKELRLDCSCHPGPLVVDEILVAAGRRANVEGLGLEAAGVEYEAGKGVTVDDYLQTTNAAIYAAGDVCLDKKFTHAADAAARIVIQNALFLGSKRVSDLVIPWCTFTDPEVAHVGLYEKEAESQGYETVTFKRDLKDVDRAVADGEEAGSVKVLVEKGKDRILGATVVARHAGEMVGELTLAIGSGLGLKTLAATIHPYPTQAEAIKQLGDAYNRTRLTPVIKELLGWVLKLPL